MKTLLIVALLAIIVGGFTFFQASQYDTGWRQLMPPETDNEFTKKQAQMIQLNGSYRKLSLQDNEKLTIQIQYGKDSEIYERMLLGRDHNEVSLFIYNYPGRYAIGSFERKERVTELRIVDEKQTSSRLYDRPLDYMASTIRDTGLGDYEEELILNDKTIYFFKVSLKKERAEQDEGDNSE